MKTEKKGFLYNNKQEILSHNMGSIHLRLIIRAALCKGGWARAAQSSKLQAIATPHKGPV